MLFRQLMSLLFTGFGVDRRNDVDNFHFAFAIGQIHGRQASVSQYGGWQRFADLDAGADQREWTPFMLTVWPSPGLLLPLLTVSAEVSAANALLTCSADASVIRITSFFIAFPLRGRKTRSLSSGYKCAFFRKATHTSLTVTVTDSSDRFNTENTQTLLIS